MASSGLFSFDFGNIFSGLGAEGGAGTSQCGSRPTCSGIFSGGNCKDKQKAYDDCVKYSIDSNARNSLIQNSKLSNQKTIRYVIIALSLIVLMWLFLHNKKNKN